MANDDGENLVSNVEVTGVDESTKALQDYAEKGGKAFDDLAASAERSSKAMGDSTDQVERNAKRASEALGNLDEAKRKQERSDKNAASQATKTAAALRQIETAAASVTRSVVRTTRDVAAFAQRVGALTAAAAAAGAGILTLASRIAKSQGTQTSAFEKANQAQQRAVQANLSAEQSLIGLQAQQRQLNRQLAQGTIDYEQYAAAVRSNKESYAEQVRVTRQLEAAQESAREENERLKKSLEDRKAYEKLVDTYGGPLTSSLTSLGNVVIQVKKNFLDAFGPSVASLVDTVTSALSGASQSIGAFVDGLASKLSAFVSQNGPEIQKALSAMGEGVKAVFTGIIDALPVLLRLFNEQLVPAFRTVASIADTITAAFNRVFGTQFSTGALVITAAIISMAGGFRVLYSSMQTVLVVSRLLLLLFSTNPIGMAITALIVALGLLYMNWDKVVSFMTEKWRSVVTAVSSGVDSIKGFFQSIGEGIADRFNAATKVVVDAWNSVVEFFQSLPETVWNIFVEIGDKIKQAFSDAFDAVKDYILSWIETVKGYLQPIVDMINFIASAGGGGGGGSGQNFREGGKVRGPGTSTSDSIPAWLSNNEYVVRAKAVRKYGTAFMNAINRGALDPERIIRGFAQGGSPFANLAPAMRFAPVDGGSGGSDGGTLNLTLGDQTFSGLRIPDRDTADALSRYVVQQQMTSGGRKPSWMLPRR